LKRLLQDLKNSIFLALFCLVALSSCDWLKMKSEDPSKNIDEQAIARANDNYLYPSDLDGVVSKEMSPQDSLRRVQQYIKSWFQKQLIIAEANKAIDFDEAEIERKILDYRYALMSHEFQENYVNQHLDTAIADAEIKTFYEESKDNYQLKQNIIKGLFVKLPRDSPKIGTFRKLFRSKKEEDRAALESYCVENALNYSLADDKWINFDEMVINSPLERIPNKVQFLKNRKSYEATEKNIIYFLSLKDYKISDQISPLDFVKDQVRNVILHRRKVKLVKKLEKDIYDKASENNEIEIY